MTGHDMQLLVGGLSRHRLRETLAVRGVELNTYAEQLLAHSCFEDPVRQEVAVIQRSVAELGLRGGGTLPQIRIAVEAAGLRPCPLETGPYLRLALMGQEQAPDSMLSAGRVPSGALHVVSEPHSGDHEDPTGFYLRVVDGTVWLRGYRCDDEYVWPPESRLALALPGPTEWS